MDDPIEWLRTGPYYEGRIRSHRRLEACEPAFAGVDLEPRLASALEDRGIDRLHRHRAEVVEAACDGDNVVLVIWTASDKSLAYAMPTFERAVGHGGRTLYLGPQNVFVADQLDTLSDLTYGLGFGSRASVGQYTGRLLESEKREVRKRMPTVLLSNPDVVHHALFPHTHRLWEWFFSSLETVAIDEVHGYRGVPGSYAALLIRRLKHVCERFGAGPQFIRCSTTIGNPVEHAAHIMGERKSSFTFVDEDTSGTGETNWPLWNPPEYGNPDTSGSGRRCSGYVETKNLSVDLVARGHRTLTFIRARQAAERYASGSASDLRSRGEHDLVGEVAAYQASLTRNRWREIEAGLHDGDIVGVWGTNALELGVDVGGPDVMLIDDYLGTWMPARQQAGRTGRGDRPALVVLVGGEDQSDQYFMNHPVEFFDGDSECAASDPENGHLLPPHVACAAAENWLSTEDESKFGAPFSGIASDLEADGTLAHRETDNGLRWTHDGSENPQHTMSLRTITDREVQLMDLRNDEIIATLAFDDAIWGAYPGVVYHHQGQTYEVTELNLDRDVARLQPMWADYYTRVLHDKHITVERDILSKPLSARLDVEVRFAEVTVRKQITGLEHRDPKWGTTIGQQLFDLPEMSLRTKALCFTVPGDMESEMRELLSSRTKGRDYGFNGGIHAAEHRLISSFPLRLLCDHGGIDGFSMPYHVHTDQSTIFIYDSHPGRVGITRAGYDIVEGLTRQTAELILDCDCEDGCPSCVQSSQCGNANDPLVKAEAVLLLGLLMGTRV